jgi:hypothetical protein
MGTSGSSDGSKTLDARRLLAALVKRLGGRALHSERFN